jgi:exopolysaccharide biosynthesis polyprenyl glycosylphosphotransferase
MHHPEELSPESLGIALGSEKRVERRPALRLRVSERKLVLVVADLSLLALALIVSLLARTELLTRPADLFWNLKWFVTLALVWLPVAAIFDAYNLARASDAQTSVSTAASVAALTVLVYLATPWLTPPLLNRSQGFLFLLLALVALTSWRWLYARLSDEAAFMRRVLVVGAGNSGRALVTALRGPQPNGGADPFRASWNHIVGFVDDDPAQRHATVEALPVLGDSASLPQLVRRMLVDEVVVAITNMETIRPELFEAILDCREMGVPVTTMSTFYERLTGRVPYAHVSRNVETASGPVDSPLARFFVMVKRLMDFAGAVAWLLPLAILMPLVALANRLDSPGPLFFRQTRVGEGGRPFKVIKFRSMVPNAEQESGPTWAAEDDRRVTSVGRVLRVTHLDEVPQVLNVLRGQMSLVGPRPERPEFVALLSERIPFYRARHAVRPGITGWAQIHQDYGDSIEMAEEKLEYDLYYLKHASPILDLTIVLRTISKMVGLSGR